MSSQLTQSKTIRAQLLASMKSGEYASSERLPRESVLSERLMPRDRKSTRLNSSHIR